MYPFVIRANMGLVMPTRAPVNAFGIGSGRDPTPGVPTVFCLGSHAKIGHPVIPGASVLVV